MSAIGKYFIQGKFEGHFTTNQTKALNASDLLPEGHEHTVKIYRGLITESTQINQSAFEESNGYYHFKRINNIQILQGVAFMGKRSCSYWWYRYCLHHRFYYI